MGYQNVRKRTGMFSAVSAGDVDMIESLKDYFIYQEVGRVLTGKMW